MGNGCERNVNMYLALGTRAGVRREKRMIFHLGSSVARSVLADVLSSPAAITSMAPILCILYTLAADLKSLSHGFLVLHQVVQLVKSLKKPTGTFF